MLSIDKEKVSQIKSKGNKFIRRIDLTALIRLNIAYTALMAKMNGERGIITALSREFMISRTFIYMLAYQLKETNAIIFGANNLESNLLKQDYAYHYILSLRLEGRCSIQGISSIMKRFDLSKASVGTISQYLTKVGSILPNTLQTDEDQTQLVVFLSDEIFSKNIPILVTVDPISSAILKIELADSRKAEDWKKHWESLEENGYTALYLVSDEGKGLCSAQKEALADVFRQPDTYHAIAHRLGSVVKSLENAAYKAIEREYNCYKKLNSAKSNHVINQRIEDYEKTQENVVKKIELYENVSYIYSEMIKELGVFDCNGCLRERKQAEGNMETSLKLLETVEHQKTTKTVKQIRRILPELFNYFDVAKSVIKDLETLSIDQDGLQTLCLAWQTRKIMTKSKRPKAVHYFRDKEQFYLEIATGYLQDDFDYIKEQVYKKLDQIVQSSSLVECINSIIRPYLNTSRNHVNQELLNLIMFYHNNRRYKAGKRQDKTPLEILTGKEQEKDWIELLFDLIEKKDPSILDFDHQADIDMVDDYILQHAA